MHAIDLFKLHGWGFVCTTFRLEVWLGFHTNHFSSHNLRELANIGVVILHRANVAGTRYSNTILSTFKLDLQITELLIGF